MIAYMIIGIVVICVLLDAWLIEPSLLLIRKHKLECDITETIRIIHFTDTHFHKHFSKAHMMRIITKINQCEPDFIVFTGDLMDHYDRATKLRYELPLYLKAMRAKYAKLAVYGNHDIGGGAKTVYASVMKEGDFHVLRNEHMVFETLGLAFFGIDDILCGYEDKSTVDKRVAPTQLLLLHEPDFIEKLNMSNIELMLSGHTHGGQIRLPFLTKHFLPKGGRHYPKGVYELPSAVLSVSSGIGTTALPFRFACPGEIVLYELKPKKS